MDPIQVVRRGRACVGFWAPALLVLVLGSSACAPLILGGAVVGGALVVSDRRTGGTQLEDESIEFKSNNRLREALEGRGHINVTAYNRQVLLTGEVPDDATRKQAEQLVFQVENVRSVVNDLALGFPSSLTQRSNDTFLTGRIKAALVDAKDLQVQAFKVLTERGTVYLMGRVTEREAVRVTEVVRAVPGVAKVVRVLEVISEAELARIQPKPPADGTSPQSPSPR